ncbi:aminotransferase class III-fold pyridoxal phosphate-dependent enzyme [Embleya sp. NPDC050154]|uniref:aminotransferase class III-fold pyridoxal phosphate-dependent enzyme n=1 Tax=unclassified Embleya TaxID=2699296 RepID=UPI0037A27FC8
MTATPGGPASHTRSLAWLAEVENVVPAGCSTLAKTPHRLLPGRGAIAAAYAKDAEFTDVDGRTWLDCEMAMGTVTWGHRRPEVEEAVITQLRRGTSFSVADPLELTLAQRLLARLGVFESVKFAKSGADAVSGAVRMARAATGRDLVVATEYHGWHDWAASAHYAQGPGELGIPRSVAALTLVGRPGDIERVVDLVRGSQGLPAAVVLCPNRWSAGDLRTIAEEARSRGVVVVFDEVTCGMRMGPRGACGEADVWPDLLCISKGMANGLPLAAVLGDRHLVMRAAEVRMSNAHSSESLAFAAALACEDLLEQAPEWPSWRARATTMMADWRSRIAELGLVGRVEVRGDYSSFSLGTPGASDFWTDPVRSHLMTALADQQIFTKGYFVFSDRHTPAHFDDVERSVVAALATYRQYDGTEHC